jgi:hypothetical protein
MWEHCSTLCNMTADVKFRWCLVQIPPLPLASRKKGGSNLEHLLGSLRMTASSRSKGRFVAARTRTRSLSFEQIPSQAAINSFRVLRVASCSELPPRAPRRLSTCHTILKVLVTALNEYQWFIRDILNFYWLNKVKPLSVWRFNKFINIKPTYFHKETQMARDPDPCDLTFPLWNPPEFFQTTKTKNMAMNWFFPVDP